MSEKHEQLEFHDGLERQIKWFKLIGWILVILGFIAALWGCQQIIKDVDKSVSFLTKLGVLGSYFQGAVGSLWALAGLMFIYVAFLGQRLQMVKQDQELDAQKEQFVIQLESIKLQQFETSFFQLLQTFNQIVLNMTETKIIHAAKVVDNQEIRLQGKECFYYWYQLLAKSFTDNTLNEITNVSLVINKQHEIAAKVYFEMVYYKHLQAQLGHYFRVLYHTIKFVESSTVIKSYEDKRRYVSLVRAHLSAYELVFIFYNGICPVALKFRPLIEKYGLLEHLDKTLLLNESHKNFYNKAYV